MSLLRNPSHNVCIPSLLKLLPNTHCTPPVTPMTCIQLLSFPFRSQSATSIGPAIKPQNTSLIHRGRIVPTSSIDTGRPGAAGSSWEREWSTVTPRIPVPNVGTCIPPGRLLGCMLARLGAELVGRLIGTCTGSHVRGAAVSTFEISFRMLLAVETL
jgi:hypothetical protein